MYLHLYLCLFACLLTSTISTQPFSSRIDENPLSHIPTNFHPHAQSGDHALFFAVNSYDRLDNLSKPIQDARDIAAELERSYGFQTLVVENPSIDEIDQTIETYRSRYSNGTYPSSGQLLIFFSGHGIQEGRNGYFLAKDSDPNRPQRTGMEYDYYRNQIDQINCQHILVAIDACYSATFDPDFSTRSDRRYERPGEDEFDRILSNHEEYTTRVFWTSDLSGKRTPDRSNFAYYLLEGLRTHRSSTAYLRSSVLFSSYLEKASPKPGGGRFGRDEASSCFLFFRQTSDLPPVPITELDDWERARLENTTKAYQRYLAAYPTGQYRSQAGRAIQALNVEPSLNEVRALAEEYKLFTKWKVNPHLSYETGDIAFWAGQGYSRARLIKEFRCRMEVLEEAEKSSRNISSKGDLSYFAEQCH